MAARWHEVPLASPGGVAERSEFFKIMIASGNHSKIEKLPSVARLMRGGDRLVNKCSWMSGICSGFLHLTGENLKLLAIDTPHQSFLSTGSEVPFDKKSSFPPGEAKRKKP